MTQGLTNEEKQQILDRVEKRAAAYYHEFSGCGQMVFLALQQEFKFPNGNAVFKAATFTGQATSGLGGTCGAVVGGILAIGSASGREKIEDPIYPEPEVVDQSSGFIKSRQTVKNFYKKFENEFVSWHCRDIQLRLLGKNYDPESREDMERYRTDNARSTCAKVAGRAARLAAEIILEMPRR